MAFSTWLTRFLHSASASSRRSSRKANLNLDVLEERNAPSTVNLSGGVLTITGTAGDDRIIVTLQASTLLVQNDGATIGQYASSSVTQININTGEGNDLAEIAPRVMQPANIVGGDGKDILEAGGGPSTISGGGGGTIRSGGSSTTIFTGGTGSQLLVGGAGANTGTTAVGPTAVVEVTASNTIATKPTDTVLVNNPNPASTAPNDNNTVLSTSDVQQLLLRATAASGRDDAIIVVVDRNGRIVGVRVENGVSTAITDNVSSLVFAVDGAAAVARGAAMFSSDAAPLTSRTVGEISQSTITEREVDSSPDVTNPDSTLFGPGFVAPVEIGANFPPGVPNTGEVDLFGIEDTNRDSLLQTGANGNRFDNATDITLSARFNINTNCVPAGQTIYAPESYGYVSGILPDAQSRGVGTLPGGIPLYKNGILVGGIGVFFPGTTGYATAENSSLSSTYNPNLPDLSEEAEYMAYAAAGGSSGAGYPIGTIGGVAPVPGFNLPFGQINLNGITLNIYGPGGGTGVAKLVAYGQLFGVGSSTAGKFLPVTTGGADFLSGVPVPSGWLVVPHNGVGITAAQVKGIIVNGIDQASQTRSALRLPLGSTARMVFAVTDLDGNVVGLYRMPDAAVFSLGVAVAKARNVAYYDDPTELQPIDELPGVAKGVAFTNRTFRFLALPRYPSGAQSSPPGYFSILNDGGASLTTGLNIGAPLPANDFQSVLGYDAFHPDTNFHDPYNIANQNGVVFFPGSSALYAPSGNSAEIIGGLGVSGDGVDEDDVVTSMAQVGFAPMDGIVSADDISFRGVNLPYQNFDRNPDGL